MVVPDEQSYAYRLERTIAFGPALTRTGSFTLPEVLNVGSSNFRPRISVARAARASSAVRIRAGISRGDESTDRIMAPISVVPFARIAATADGGSARFAGSVITRTAATGTPF